MKKITFVIAIIGLFGISESSAVSSLRAHPGEPPRTITVHNDSHSCSSAKGLAMVAIGISIISLVVAVKASEQNRGQVRIARF